MHCPRCDGRLETFAVEATGATAIVCESCGFADVSATHRPEAAAAESWERAIERFDETVLPPELTCRTDRTEGVSPPAGDAGAAIDADRLEEAVAVAASLDRSPAGAGNGTGVDDGHTDPEANDADGAMDPNGDGSDGENDDTGSGGDESTRPVGGSGNSHDPGDTAE